jgi:hypothetical protein
LKYCSCVMILHRWTKSFNVPAPESAWVSWRLPNLEISRHLGLI